MTPTETAAARIAELEAALATATAPKTPKGPRVWSPLTTEEAAAAAEVARPAIAPCLCGCGATTKGRFAPGHDARHHQRLLATAAAGGEAATHAAAALTTLGWEVTPADQG